MLKELLESFKANGGEAPSNGGAPKLKKTGSISVRAQSRIVRRDVAAAVVAPVVEKRPKATGVALNASHNKRRASAASGRLFEAKAKAPALWLSEGAGVEARAAAHALALCTRPRLITVGRTRLRGSPHSTCTMGRV